MKLKSGKTKSILLSSTNSALLAVEIFNKPRVSFRREAFVTLMIIAWTKLLHAYLYQKIGDKFYYKGSNKKYIRIGSERKAWDLFKSTEEVKKIDYKLFSSGVEANLDFFRGLRDKIEHRHVEDIFIDTLAFGEYQALLYNYEAILVKLFGNEFAINENLAFSLQFSKIRSSEQIQANKSLLSRDVSEIKDYIDKFRTSLSKKTFDSQDYSVKLLLIPKISNTKRTDLAVEFVNWSNLSKTDRKSYKKVAGIIKDKIIKTEAINVGKLKVKTVVLEVNKALPRFKFYTVLHTNLVDIFAVRPVKAEVLRGLKKENDTITEFCHYDEVHNDYVYKESWVQFIVRLFTDYKFNKSTIKQLNRKREKLNYKDYLASKV
jgi:hypothetical protein